MTIAYPQAPPFGHLVKDPIVHTFYDVQIIPAGTESAVIYFFQDHVVGAHADDGTVIREEITNFHTQFGLAKGQMFNAKTLKVDGLKDKFRRSTMVSLVIDSRYFERGPVDIMEENEFSRPIDGLRVWGVELRALNPDCWKKETTIRVRVRGLLYRPVL